MTEKFKGFFGCSEVAAIVVTMAADFLTPIYTSSGKRLLISDCNKGPLVAAFRSPLMEVLDRKCRNIGSVNCKQRPGLFPQEID